jgi:hypothetical protein
MLRRWFADMSLFAWIAAALFVLGTGFVLADLQSPSLLQWTGTEVSAVQSGGITYYSFHGVQYTISGPLLQQSSTTVYLDPTDPSIAMFSRPWTKWIEAVAVLGSYATSALALAFGFARRSRRSQRKARVNA